MGKRGLLVTVLLLVTFVGLRGLLRLERGFLEETFSYITYPFIVVQQKISAPFRAWRERRRIVHNLLDEYSALVADRDCLLKQVVELGSYVRNYADSDDLRSFMKRYVTTKIYAPIVVRSFQGEHFYLVDAGSAEGVTTNMIAVHNNALVGKIVEVYPQYSKVQLISDPSCHIAAQTVEQGTQAIHVGAKHGATLQYVDHRDQLKKGDLLISSGEGGLYPRGFGLGKVDHIDISAYGRTVAVTPLLDYQKLSWVALLPNRITALETGHSQ